MPEEEKETEFLMFNHQEMNNKKLEKYLLSHYSSSTVESYLRTITEFQLSNKNASKMTYLGIVKYMQQVQSKYNGSTPTRILSAIKKYYDFLVESGERKDHPCKNYFVRVKQNRSIQFDNLFTGNELELLLEREERYKGMRERNRAMFSLLIYQGLTLQELKSMNMTDIDFNEGIVKVRRTSRNMSRALRMEPKQVAIMIEYRDVRDDLLKVKTDKLLVSQRGVPMTGDSINAIVESMKLLFLDRNLNPQTIRQSVISNWLNVKNKPLDEVQIMAGHRHPSSTEKYIRKDMKNHVEIINRFHPLG